MGTETVPPSRLYEASTGSNEPRMPMPRRALLTASLGALAATIASAIGRPLMVSAADGEAVIVGGEYEAESVTKFHTGSSGANGLWGSSDGSVGVRGTGGPGIGASSGTGVLGESDGGFGVHGISSLSGGAGVRGVSGAGPGVSGTSTLGPGVFGTSTSGLGVAAISFAGTAVSASSTNGTGISASSTSGIEIWGDSNAGNQPAILGVSVGASSGRPWLQRTRIPTVLPLPRRPVSSAMPRRTRLRSVSGASPLRAAAPGRGDERIGGTGCRHDWGRRLRDHDLRDGDAGADRRPQVGYGAPDRGRVRFDNSVGLATIAAGTTSVTVTPGIDLTATSAVVATLQGASGGALVYRVSIDATADRFTIHLTKNTTVAVKVAWHVFG